jgi:signal transduction histidine kinase
MIPDGCAGQHIKEEFMEAANPSHAHATLSLQAAVRAARMALWQWSPQDDEALWSPEVYDLLRLPRGDGRESGARFMKMIHADDLARVDAAMAGVESKGGIDPFIFRITAGDGSTRWLMSCSQAAPSSADAPPRLVGVNIDVTDVVEAEARVKEASAARERQELIMQAVLDHAPVGIAVTLAGEDRLAYVSRFGEDMLKKPGGGGDAWDAWQVYHLDGKTAATKEQMALSRAAAGEVIRNEEWLIRAYDGSLLPVSCNAGPIATPQGTIIGATVVWYDVTPFKEAQRQRDSFMAAVSHELRTPLSAILGWAQALSRTDDAAVIAKGLDAIQRNAQTQARLIDDLLDLSRMAAGKLALKLTSENLVAIARASVDTVTPIAMSAQVTLALEVAAGLELPVLADDLRLGQAIWNLLTNAVKFSRPGGLVQIEVVEQEGVAVLRVTDHGVGIEADNLERVFEEFWQAGTRDTMRRQGMGLGLAIARHIVVGHGGTLTVRSPGLGLGSTFVLSVPLRKSAGLQVL